MRGSQTLRRLHSRPFMRPICNAQPPQNVTQRLNLRKAAENDKALLEWVSSASRAPEPNDVDTTSRMREIPQGRAGVTNWMVP